VKSDSIVAVLFT